ncbi:MAG: hypothetical protein E7345_00395 [Clostridiales bacterium]|nr:hypothetical protein [Clostridiales bacterium]
MNKWIISIVGVVFLGILFDLIYPNGKTNKLCKSVFGLIVLCVIIAPIMNFDFDLNFNENSIDVGTYEEIKESRDNLLIKQIEGAILGLGIQGAFVELSSNYGINGYEIENISIDISNIVLLENVTNINKYEVIVEEVIRIANIDREKVVVYG